MSNKQLIRLAIALGALLVLWAVVALVRRPPEDRSASIALPKIDSTTVDTIVFAKAKDTAVLTRGANKRWLANGFLAAQSAVTDLFKGLADSARQTELVAESKASRERLGVAADSGERVRVVSGSRSLLDLTVGKRTPDYSGVYVRRTNEDAVYALHGLLADPLAKALEDWRDKHILSVSPDSVGTVEVKRGTGSYTLKRSGSTWSFVGNTAKVDSTQVGYFLGSYRDLNASGFASTVQTDSIRFGKNARHAKLMSKAGATMASLTFDSTASGNWVKADSGGPVYKLDSWTWGQLTPAESTLKVKPPPKPAKAPAPKK